LQLPLNSSFSEKTCVADCWTVELLKLHLIVFMDNALETCAGSFSQILQLVQHFVHVFHTNWYLPLIVCTQEFEVSTTPLDKDELLKIQEKIASFIMDQVISSNGDHHYQNPRFTAR